MKINKILQLSLIFGLFSIVGIIIANSTYSLLKQRVQTIYSLEADPFVLNETVPFNYRQELITTVKNINSKQETDAKLNCKVEKSTGIIPISIENNFDIFNIELIGSDISENQICIDDIINHVSNNFYSNVEKKLMNYQIIKLIYYNYLKIRTY